MTSETERLLRMILDELRAIRGAVEEQNVVLSEPEDDESERWRDE